MSRIAIDLTGEQFGRFVVVRRIKNDGRGNACWHCLCLCGEEVMVRGSHLRSGTIISCGCYRKEARTTHGCTGIPEYNAYMAMLSRCSNPRHPEYKRYGGRGIRVYDRWRNSFELFLADMGPRPSSKHSLDRIDNDGDYEPINCRWATQIEQQNNRRNNRILTYGEKSLTIAQWVRKTGIPRRTIYYRLDKGWPIEMILS